MTTAGVILARRCGQRYLRPALLLLIWKLTWLVTGSIWLYDGASAREANCDDTLLDWSDAQFIAEWSMIGALLLIVLVSAVVIWLDGKYQCSQWVRCPC